MRASVIGLGKLGAPLAAVLASKGFPVIGSDQNHASVDAINAGRAPVDEPNLQDLVSEHRDRLSATVDAAAAVAQTDITFIIVPTPSEETGRFSNRFVLSAIERVGAGLRQKAGSHVVVVTSTVMPGSMGGEIRESIEAHSGRRVGDGIGLCYNPLFVALGSVVRDLLTPELILIGESDQRAGDVVAQIHGTICDGRPAIHRMAFVNAELAKIAVNTFVTTKITFANMLADVCDRLPSADVDIVTRAVGSDSRIGTKSLRGTIGYGGPCFPRDNAAFAALARSLGARAELAESTDSLNRYQIERVLGAVVAQLRDGGPVGVLGLAYKPDTSVVEQSQGVALVERLLQEGHQVVAYDPKALEHAQSAVARPFTAAASAEDCVRRASVVALMTPWPEFGAIATEAFVRPQPLPVVDCWRLLSPERIGAVADLVYIGRGITSASTVSA
jgi:UDPglucose 6-dehydrogenase